MGRRSWLPARSAVFLAISLSVPAVLVAGCGGDEEADYSGDSSTGATIELKAKDFSFTPGKLTANMGDPFDIVLTNAGDAPHTFTIDELDVDTEVPAGQKMTVSVTPKDSGTFTFYCRFHRNQGMEGNITISGTASTEDGLPTGSPVDDPYYDY